MPARPSGGKGTDQPVDAPRTLRTRGSLRCAAAPSVREPHANQPAPAGFRDGDEIGVLDAGKFDWTGDLAGHLRRAVAGRSDPEPDQTELFNGDRFRASLKAPRSIMSTRVKYSVTSSPVI